jgi:hypothetical protein
MNSQDVQQVRAYFLGELGEKEALEIEMCCFDDEDFAEQIFVVESELIEAYLDGELSGREFQHFESNYLMTVARRSRVELVANLKGENTVNTRQPVPLAAFPSGKKPLFTSPSNWWNRFLSPPVKLGFAVGLSLFLLVLCMGLFRFLTHPKATNDDQSAWESTSETNASSSLPINLSPSIAQENLEPNGQITASAETSKTNHPANKPPLDKKPNAISPEKQRKQTPGHAVSKQVSFAVTLFPGGLRDDSVKPQYVHFSSEAEFAEINLASIKSADSEVRAELQTVEGSTLWQVDLKTKIAKNNGKAALLRVPTNFLDEKTYVIILFDRGGQMAEYSFQAKKQSVK